MNPIAAHKDEFKQLLEKLSSGAAVSGITFVTSLDAYLARLATNCSGIKEHVNPPPAQRKWRINMEPTLSQNCALYYAQHKASKRRATLFKELRAAACKQDPDVRQQLTFGDVYVVPRLHQDNGR